MRHRRNRITQFVIAALVVLAAVPAALVSPALVSPALARSERPAPGFNLPARTGTACLDSLRGKVVLVDFWASWCEPCRRSFPWLRSLDDRYASKGLVVVAINLDKTRAAAEKFLSEFPPPFPVAFDPSGKTAKAFQVSALPTTFLVGPTGNILYSHPGFDPKMTGMIEAMIEKACSP